MRFYTKQHKFYCGIDLHARQMYLCVLDQTGEIRLHLNINTDSEVFVKSIEPFREDVVVAVECMFTWYWIAEVCARENVPICHCSRPLYESNTRRQSQSGRLGHHSILAELI